MGLGWCARFREVICIAASGASAWRPCYQQEAEGVAAYSHSLWPSSKGSDGSRDPRRELSREPSLEDRRLLPLGAAVAHAALIS